MQQLFLSVRFIIFVLVKKLKNCSLSLLDFDVSRTIWTIGRLLALLVKTKVVLDRKHLFYDGSEFRRMHAFNIQIELTLFFDKILHR